MSQITSYLDGLNGTIIKTFNMFNKTFLVNFDQAPNLDSSLVEQSILDDNQPIQLLATTIIPEYDDLSTYPTLEISTTDKKDWWKMFVLKDPEFTNETMSVPKLGQNITVYVLDSGIELTHTEFENRPVSFIHSFNNDFTDQNGHGTAIASIITGKSVGITNANVKAVKIFDQNTPTLQSDLIQALDVLGQDFMSSPEDYALVNCSWSIPKNSFIEQKMLHLTKQGLYFIVSAGNSGTVIENVTPASMAYAIVIGSYDEELKPCNFSNYTSDLSTTPGEVNHGRLSGWAPGNDIYVALKNNTYGYVSGTSFSAAIHSAVVAATYSVNMLDNGTTHIVNPQLDPIAQELCFENGVLSVEKHLIYVDYLSFKNLPLSRQGLLDLDDPKYVNSENRVSSLRNKKYAVSEFKLGFNAVGYGGSKQRAIVFYPEVTSKVELISELPNHFTLNKHGWLIGTAPSVTEITKTQIEMIVYDKNDQSFPLTFEIITLPLDFDPNTYQGDDPVLQLKLGVYGPDGSCLNFNCQTNSKGCVYDCFGSPCTYFFVPAPYCRGTLKNTNVCKCD